MFGFNSTTLLVAFALSLGDLSTGQISGDSQPQKEIAVPRPMDLSHDWWLYFDRGKGNLDERIENFVQELEELQQNLNPEEIEAAAPYLTKILIQLDVYQSLDYKDLKEPVTPPFQKTYTIQQIALLAEELLKTEAKLKQEKKEQFQLTKQKTRLQNHLDRQFIEYAKIEKRSLSRLTLGLDIIASRFTVAIKDKLLRSVNQKVSNLHKRRSILREELEFAFDHLNEDNIDKEAIKRQIDELEAELSKRQSESLRAELKALGHYGTSDQDQIQGFLLQQLAVDSELEDLNFEVDIATLKLILLLDQYGESANAEQVQGLLERTRKIRDRLQSIGELTREKTEITNEDYVPESSGSAEDQDSLASVHKEFFEVQQSSLNKIASLKDKLFFANLLADQLEEHFQSRQSGWFCCWYSVTDYYEMSKNFVLGIFSYRVFRVNELPITIGNIFSALIVFVLILIISSLVRRSLRKFSLKIKGMNESSLYVLDRLIYYASLLIAIFFFFYALGFDTTNILLIIGGLSVGIGFGLQSIVNNFVSSIIVLFHRMVKLGDLIQLPTGEWGKVVDINFQNTVFHTWDGTDIVFPNAELLTQKFENWTLNDGFKRLHIPFGVAYGSDKELVTKAVLEAADRVPCTVKGYKNYADPAVWLTDFQDSALGFELVVWVNLNIYTSVGSYIAAYKWEIESALVANGIVIPFPQRDLHIKDGLSIPKVPS